MVSDPTEPAPDPFAVPPVEEPGSDPMPAPPPPPPPGGLVDPSAEQPEEQPPSSADDPEESEADLNEEETEDPGPTNDPSFTAASDDGSVDDLLADDWIPPLPSER